MSAVRGAHVSVSAKQKMAAARMRLEGRSRRAVRQPCPQDDANPALKMTARSSAPPETSAGAGAAAGP